MPIDYVAYNQAGARVTGVVEVESEREAEEELWASGLVVVSLAPRALERSETFMQRLLPRLAGTKINDTIEFTRQLATLLRAGISLHPALRQLREESRSLGMRHALGLIVRDIERGERFSRRWPSTRRCFLRTTCA